MMTGTVRRMTKKELAAYFKEADAAVWVTPDDNGEFRFVTEGRLAANVPGYNVRISLDFGDALCFCVKCMSHAPRPR